VAQLPGRYHGPAERCAELVGPGGSVRAAVLVDRRCFVVGDSVVVEAVVCNQTDVPLHCTAVLQQVRAGHWPIRRLRFTGLTSLNITLVISDNISTCKRKESV